MASLFLYFLGAPRVERDRRPVEFDSRKAIALLAYLAVTGRPHRRDTLAALLWPESDSPHSRGALRRTLASIRRVAGPQWLEADQETVGLRHPGSGLWTDVGRFQSRLAASRRDGDAEVCAEARDALGEAVRLYRDDFLAGFSLKDSPEFDHWQVAEAERLRAGALTALERLVRHHRVHGPWETALAHARRWLALDRLSETAHCHLIELLAWTGRRGDALRRHAEFVRGLDDELGIEPLPATVELCESIRAGRLPGPAARGPVPATAGAAEPSPPGAAARLAATAPRRPASSEEDDGFIGRRAELAHLRELLTATPACRLLSLLGPGGIGKTRLALAAAAESRAAFADGVHVVPLAAVTDGELVVPAIARALGLGLPAHRDPRAELLAVLREHDALLVLDNVEHLLDAVDLFTDLLAAAPGLKLLVTSRERLAVAPEWSFEVEGLAVPEADEAADPLDYSAVRLFLAHARKVRPDFAPTADDLGEIVRLCRLTRGMPLALELAAPWLRVLPPAEIGAEVAAGLDLLATTRRDAADRHRSMRAVFEESFQRLDEDERRVFAALSVFSGGFRRRAAEPVAGAALPALAALADKSFLKRSESGRYEIHELLRQYGEEKLAARPEEAERTRERHADHYAALLEERAAALQSAAQRSALDEITDELENVRAAWRYAAGRAWTEPLEKAAEALFHFYEIRGWFHEGHAAFEAAARALRRDAASRPPGPPPRALGLCLIGQASFAHRLGDYERARGLFGETRAVAAQLGTLPEQGLALVGLGLSAKVRGEYGESARCFEEALGISDRAGYRWGTGLALQALGEMAYGTGRYPEARALLGDSLAAFRGLGDRRMIARVLVGLARIAFFLGEHAEARRLFEESLATSREIEDRWGVGLSLQRLGAVAEKTGELEAAEGYFEESLRLYREMGDRHGTVASRTGLARVAAGRGDDRAALGHLQAALAVALELQATPLALAALVAAAPALARRGAPETAAEILVLAADHPALTKETRKTVARLRAELPEAARRGPPAPRGLEELAAAVLADDPAGGP